MVGVLHAISKPAFIYIDSTCAHWSHFKVNNQVLIGAWVFSQNANHYQNMQQLSQIQNYSKVNKFAVI